MEVDVNDVLTDPSMRTEFSVVRRSESVGADGRSQMAEERIDDLLGIITWADGDVESGEDLTRTGQAISIATPFSLRDASFGFQPDLVVWNGEQYRVNRIKAHRHVGRGWTRATATSVRATDNPPPVGSTT
jgi:hypothetical protein